MLSIEKIRANLLGDIIGMDEIISSGIVYSRMDLVRPHAGSPSHDSNNEGLQISMLRPTFRTPKLL